MVIVSELLSNLGTDLGIIADISINVSAQRVFVNCLFFEQNASVW